ncbi:hypothetical protein ACIHQR_33305 [Corallococcus coralloides]|uniref:hypothetical protein n=1 Tax=Corallococcus coralloides TaxID=184914 RepID=UPI00384BE97A
MRPLKLVRFNALAAYSRQPPIHVLTEELAWFEHANERVLGVVVRDRTDGDFAGVVFGRDRRGRFRAVYTTAFHPNRLHAKAYLRREMERISMAPNEEHYQGDEDGPPLDFFSSKLPRDKLSQDFLKLSETEAFVAARRIIDPMMHWYEDPDGNFIEQFQTTGFNARIWELYLFAAFVEMGYRIERIHAVPDFTCEGVLGEFAVEAVTVNPTRDKTGAVVPLPRLDTREATHGFLRDYMPIKFGSALTTKLAKRYWKKPNVAGKPLLFAIQDFSAPMSMVFTRSALPLYLSGYTHEWEHDPQGQLRVYPRKIPSHKWQGKEIPSGFFNLPEAENISAIVFSNSGTLSKFNRMGVLAGFGSPRVRMTRLGQAVDPTPNAVVPKDFKLSVNSPDYTETWVEGLDVYHNPKAKHPLDPSMIPGAAHYFIQPDGYIESVSPAWHPLGSVTHIEVQGEP